MTVSFFFTLFPVLPRSSCPFQAAQTSPDRNVKTSEQNRTAP